MSLEERKAQHLSIKIEGAIPQMYANLCGKDVKDIYILPDKSIFQMEPVVGKVKYPTKKRKIVRVDPTHPASHDAYDS